MKISEILINWKFDNMKIPEILKTKKSLEFLKNENCWNFKELTTWNYKNVYNVEKLKISEIL